MFIKSIEISKSATLGLNVANRVKFNKVTVTLGAELTQGEDYAKAYKQLSNILDKSLQQEIEKNSNDITINQKIKNL